MALNVAVFKTRSLTALVFVAVMALGLLGGYLPFLLLFMVVQTGCWMEYFKLIGRIDVQYKTVNVLHKFGVVVCGISLMLWMTKDDAYFLEMNLFEIGCKMFFGLLSLIMIYDCIQIINQKNSLRPYIYSLLGMVYISFSLGLLVDLRGTSFFSNEMLPANSWIADNTDMLIPLCIIFSIWINDTMAYLVGSFIGKTPLSSISPKKTWEGTLGGMILTVLTIWLLSTQGFNLPATIPVGIAIIAAIVGTLGDLLESKIKRLAGVKDSGSIMPGHGGFLDRFDSLLPTVIAVWIFLRFF